MISNLSLFAYADHPHVRRHGPIGYPDYRRYKPWLRDEFSFRCVYCLFRERWYPSGHASFSIDHAVPQSQAPERVTDYENLLYSCSLCNSLKQDLLLLNPCGTAFAAHLHVDADGRITAISTEGLRLIRVLKLDRLNEWRARLFRVLARLAPFANLAASELKSWFGFPHDLPNLCTHTPPEGNCRPEGIAQSHYEQQQRGELAACY